MKKPATKILLGTLVIPATFLIGACGASPHSSASSSQTAVSTGPAGGSGGALSGSGTTAAMGLPGRAPAGVPEPAQLGKADAVASTPTGAETAAVISKGQISLRTKDIDKARFDLQKLLDTWGGTIANEQSDADKQGNTERTRLELRVPSGHFNDAMTAIPRLGRLVDQSRSSEDVTTQVIDNNSRIRSQQLSLDRIQALMASAQNLNQVIAIEGQLSERQANLDSLEQQQKYLADQTSLSTIDLYLAVPDKAPAAAHQTHKTFWSGLRNGWHHLGTSTAAVLNGVGTVLPFALLLGLVGVPCWLLWRRHAPRSAPAES